MLLGLFKYAYGVQAIALKFMRQRAERKAVTEILEMKEMNFEFSEGMKG
jgi:hypothetical protein